MTMKSKTPDELIALAKKFIGNHETGPILKELVSRMQVLASINVAHQQQYFALAAENHCLEQRDDALNAALEIFLKVVDEKCSMLSELDKEALTPALQLISKAATTEITVNQIKAQALENLQAPLMASLNRSNAERRSSVNEVSAHRIQYVVTSTIQRQIAELIHVPIVPVTVTPNEFGCWSHPAVALQPDGWSEGTEADEIKAWFMDYGLDVTMAPLAGSDEDPDVESLASIPPDWEPSCPGEGWFLFSIFETEDGLYSEWVIRISADPDGGPHHGN